MSIRAYGSAGTRVDLDPRLFIMRHDIDHGFCRVCGSVWPCYSVRKAEHSA